MSRQPGVKGKMMIFPIFEKYGSFGFIKIHKPATLFFTLNTLQSAKIILFMSTDAVPDLKTTIDHHHHDHRHNHLQGATNCCL